MDAPFLWDKMKKIYPALSIVAPMGRQISQGNKTLGIRSWRPEQWPLKDLIIVETDDGNKTELTIDDLSFSDYVDYEIGDIDMWIDNRKIHIEFNIEASVEEI